MYAGLPSLSERVFRTAVDDALFGAYPAALVLGVPALLALRGRVRASPLNCAVTGAVVASLPWLLLGLISSPDFASSDGHTTVQDGAMTWWGWVELFEFVGAIALAGAAGGIVFWAVAAAGAEQSERVST